MASLYPLWKEVETAIVVENFHNRHCCYEKEYYLCRFANVFYKNVLGDVFLNGYTVGYCSRKERGIVRSMLLHHKVCTKADI